MNAPARPTAAPSGGIKPKKDAPAAEPEAPAKKSKKLLFIIGGAVVAAAAGAYFFLFAGSGEEKAEPEPVPGEVLTVEAMSLNLADGHYLRLGLGLQLIADLHHDVDAAKARDAAIALFSGRTVADVTNPETRDALKAELAETLIHDYHGEVIEVYLTDYVTQ
ncbi:flagellar basal body-associated FliL family protein [Sanguibacter sp. YZGR15]|uniref:Flagellar protein FliL n=2 Tax=Sanguibacter suaedae TaxID=2795737 RepID=A0A934M6S6_9MICO|nr:flagellar basal body-associated FliL family protein [Sanguibacter suaedae]